MFYWFCIPFPRRTLTICLYSSLWCLISPCQSMEWFLKLEFEACLIRTPLFLSLQISITLCFLSTRRNLWFQGIFFPPIIQSHSLLSLLEPKPSNFAPSHLHPQGVLLPWKFLLFLQMFSDTLTSYLKHLGSFFSLTSDHTFTPLSFSWY